MKLLGRILAFIAQRLLDKPWRRLARDLARVYATYRATIKPVVPPILLTTLVTAEDRRFYKHRGVDPIAIGRAILYFMCRGKLTGASTIEQQLVRTMARQYERTVRRKAREILMSCLVQRIIPKSDIPGVYLSVAYFGWRMNGIQQACRRLGVELASMTSFQAASIVARLKYPEPSVASPQRARQIAARTDYVLKLVARRGDAIRADAEEAAKHYWFVPPPDDMEIIRRMVIQTAERYGVPSEIALRVAQVESGFNPEARGAGGEIGVMQLMPGTATLMGVNPFDLAQNIEGGIKYLRWKWNMFHDWGMALAAYNAGDAAVTSGRWLSHPEVQRYVRSTLGWHTRVATAMIGSPSALSAGPEPRLPSAMEPSSEAANASEVQGD